MHHDSQRAEGAAGDAGLRDANKSLKSKLTQLPVRGIDRAASCRLIGNRTVLHNKC